MAAVQSNQIVLSCSSPYDVQKNCFQTLLLHSSGAVAPPLKNVELGKLSAAADLIPPSQLTLSSTESHFFWSRNIFVSPPAITISLKETAAAAALLKTLFNQAVRSRPGPTDLSP